jgi:hypothetical protein
VRNGAFFGIHRYQILVAGAGSSMQTLLEFVGEEPLLSLRDDDAKTEIKKSLQVKAQQNRIQGNSREFYSFRSYFYCQK